MNFSNSNIIINIYLSLFCLKILLIANPSTNSKSYDCNSRKNLNRIQCIKPTDQTMDSHIDLDVIIRASYYKEPFKFRIVDECNVLERTMLHFANYEKIRQKSMRTPTNVSYTIIKAWKPNC